MLTHGGICAVARCKTQHHRTHRRETHPHPRLPAITTTPPVRQSEREREGERERERERGRESARALAREREREIEERKRGKKGEREREREEKEKREVKDLYEEGAATATLANISFHFLLQDGIGYTAALLYTRSLLLL
jgi:hypothetical protein